MKPGCAGFGDRISNRSLAGNFDRCLMWGAHVKISAQSLVQNIVSFPPDVTIGAGQSSAIFDVTAAGDTFSIEEVVIMASYGSRALANRLTVVGSPR